MTWDQLPQTVQDSFEFVNWTPGKLLEIKAAIAHLYDLIHGTALGDSSGPSMAMIS